MPTNKGTYQDITGQRGRGRADTAPYTEQRIEIEQITICVSDFDERLHKLELESGQYAALSGRLELRNLVGIGGEAPPSGYWLILSQELRIDKLHTTEVYLETLRSYPEGYTSRFHGRVALGQYGGVERPLTSYARMTGVSDVGADEPIYDGERFLSGINNASLQSLVIDPDELARDVPSRVIVPDPFQRIAYAGMVGGFQSPLESYFQGFYGQAPMTAPTDADRTAIVFDQQGSAFNAASGAQLTVLTREEPEEPHPDALYVAYLFDSTTDTIYRVVSGGLAGFMNRIEWVVRVPHRAC